MQSSYIDCDCIICDYSEEYIKKYNPKYKSCIHPNLNDYDSLCNSGLWRDGSIGNALLKLRTHQANKLHVFKNGNEILVIDNETPKEMYKNKEVA